jgi:guanyl-specific ribonuclease Sa
MRRKLAAIFALLLSLALLFTACAPAAPATPTDYADEPEETYDLVVVTDEPTDETPADAHETSPPDAEAPTQAETDAETEAAIDEHGVYTSKDDVALYIHTYGRLPENFISKKDAQDLGWSGGSLEPYAPGKCIGGSRFGNYEGLLPEKPGRTYTECDIDTLGKNSRGAKRIVFSNDGLIYYTDDHYEHFTLLYGEE